MKIKRIKNQLMYISKSLKNFIKINEENIENNDWDKVYIGIKNPFNNNYLRGEDISTLTKIFNEAHINPLDYMNYIPSSYFFNNPLGFTAYTTPPSIYLISRSAFEQCKKLRAVVLSESVNRVASISFTHCTDLKEVTICNNTCRISPHAFIFCNNLQKVTFKGNKRELYSTETDWYELCEGAHIKKLIIECNDGIIEVN